MKDRQETRTVSPATRTAGCRWLRWKTMYLDREEDPLAPNMVDGFVWCVHTMNCLGPDDEVAAHEDCVAGRGCFTPHGAGIEDT